MKAFTAHQPSATLLALGEKQLETRTWLPPEGLNGARVAIHAARRPLPRELLLADPERESSVWATARWILESRLDDAWRELPLGAVIATAMLQVEGRTEELLNPTGMFRLGVFAGPDASRLEDFTPGRWAWRLTDVIRFQPGDEVVVSGRQRFWELPYAIDRKVRAASERGIRL